MWRDGRCFIGHCTAAASLPALQAVGGRKGAGRPPAAAKAAAAGGGGAGGVVALDKRVPALSIGCLCKLLDAIVDDGLVGGGGGAVRAPAVCLCASWAGLGPTREGGGWAACSAVAATPCGSPSS